MIKKISSASFSLKLIISIIIGGLFLSINSNAQEMDKMWGERDQKVKIDQTISIKGKRFREGKYAMFVHWGLYSHFANKWDGKTYYGIGEWMMNENMANLTTEKYVPVAKEFNPIDFDAEKLVQLAKDAGMKYIIITAKHHDGFAMYDSKVSDFNIVKATPFKRDPMKELSKACADAGLGFGFYYSHNQDWTTPYGTVYGKNDGLDPTSYESYFRNKCLPQVEEITRNYGPIELVWFDTPGNMKKEFVEELVAVVRKNQPNAFVSGRAGHDLGDYNTLGDMEIPVENEEGLWETVDVTNDAWGYAWYDENWKSPNEILERLISTVARGGTYMLNVGPNGKGTVPQPAQKSLQAAGEWLKRYPQVVYNGEGSPWRHALPWGDVIQQGSKLYLCVYEWPATGKLYLPGLKNKIEKSRLLKGGQSEKLKTVQNGGWTVVHIPYERADKLVSVIELDLDGKANVNPVLGLDPGMMTELTTDFASAQQSKQYKKGWMEKFGEWKHINQITEWENNGSAIWKVEVLKPGYYQVDLSYSGAGKVVWRVEHNEGVQIQNQQNSSAIYAKHPIGWMNFEKAGIYDIKVSLVEGKRKEASLNGISFTPIIF